MGENRSSYVNYINSSGFAFQLAVEDEVNKSKDDHGWEVVGREHYWEDLQHGKDGFIDLVLASFHRPYRAVVECKLQRAQTMVFLTPSQSSETRTAALLWSKAIHKDHSRIVYRAWGEILADPTAYISAFCTVQGQSDRDRPMLERIASDVVLMSESLAKDESGIVGARIGGFPIIYIPVIVTVAKLMVCKLAVSDMDLETGALPEDKAEFIQVPFVQFRKGLQSNVNHGGLDYANMTASVTGLRDLNRFRERSVFVVQADQLVNFLKIFDLQQENSFSMYKYPWGDIERILRNPPSNL